MLNIPTKKLIVIIGKISLRKWSAPYPFIVLASLLMIISTCEDRDAVFSQSKEISSDLCCFYGGGTSHNEDIMHSFQKFIVVSVPTTLPLWKQGHVN